MGASPHGDFFVYFAQPRCIVLIESILYDYINIALCNYHVKNKLSYCTLTGVGGGGFFSRSTTPLTAHKAPNEHQEIRMR